MSEIIGKEYPLLKIFTKDFDFHIPVYQRPYSWEEENAEELFDDLYEAYSNNPEDDYFLGSIVIKRENERNPHSEVTDGQQRLITLTIFLAAVAAYLRGRKQDSWIIFGATKIW